MDRSAKPRQFRAGVKKAKKAGLVLFLTYLIKIGLGAPTDEPLKNPRKYHDTITFFPNTNDRIFGICAPLYAQKGLFARD